MLPWPDPGTRRIGIDVHLQKTVSAGSLQNEGRCNQTDASAQVMGTITSAGLKGGPGHVQAGRDAAPLAGVI